MISFLNIGLVVSICTLMGRFSSYFTIWYLYYPPFLINLYIGSLMHPSIVCYTTNTHRCINDGFVSGGVIIRDQAR